jgi:hypothetical protein
MPSISEVDPAVTHAVKNLQTLSQERRTTFIVSRLLLLEKTTQFFILCIGTATVVMEKLCFILVFVNM